MGDLAQYTDGGVDPSQHEPQQDFQPLPPGWYAVEIEKATVVPTKAGTGQMLKVQFNVIGENYANRKIFTQLNIANPSQQAQEIGRRQLADLARACNIGFLDDEDKLLNQQLEIRVVIKKDPGFELDNDVKAFRPLGGVAATPPTQAPPASGAANATAAAPNSAASSAASTPSPAQQAATQPGKMPWER